MEERDFSEIVEEKKELLDQSFRDSVATISKQGKRNYIFPKKPKGRYYNLRTLTSIIYLVVFFTLPFIKVDEEPLFLFNVLERKFIFFGQVFWPQDFFIFAIGLLTFIVFIIFFGVAFLESIRDGNLLLILFWFCIGIFFLFADNIKRKH